MTISNTSLQKYFQAHNVKTCPMCGGSDWTWADNMGFDLALPLDMDRSSGGLSLVTMICDGCGHVMLFSRMRVVEWIEKSEQNG